MANPLPNWAQLLVAHEVNSRTLVRLIAEQDRLRLALQELQEQYDHLKGLIIESCQDPHSTP